MDQQRFARRAAPGTQFLQQGVEVRHIEEETAGAGVAYRLQCLLIIRGPQGEPRGFVRKVNVTRAAQTYALRYESAAELASQPARPVANTKHVQREGEQPLQQL